MPGDKDLDPHISLSPVAVQRMQRMQKLLIDGLLSLKVRLGGSLSLANVAGIRPLDILASQPSRGYPIRRDYSASRRINPLSVYCCWQTCSRRSPESEAEVEAEAEEEVVNYTTATWPSDRWPNFSFAELACQATGECRMDPLTMDKLQMLRSQYGQPIVVSSGYRSPDHSIEAAKEQPGTHAKGRAIDIACAGVDAYEVLTEALIVGFTGIGVSQQGAARFLHLDDLGPGEHSVPRPSIWSY